MEGYQKLANAIIIQAAEDYRRLYEQFELNPNDKKVNYELRSIERFFHSGWFSALTKLDGPQLLEDLKSDIRERNGESA